MAKTLEQILAEGAGDWPAHSSKSYESKFTGNTGQVLDSTGNRIIGKTFSPENPKRSTGFLTTKMGVPAERYKRKLEIPERRISPFASIMEVEGANVGFQALRPLSTSSQIRSMLAAPGQTNKTSTTIGSSVPPNKVASNASFNQHTPANKTYFNNVRTQFPMQEALSMKRDPILKQQTARPFLGAGGFSDRSPVANEIGRIAEGAPKGRSFLMGQLKEDAVGIGKQMAGQGKRALSSAAKFGTKYAAELALGGTATGITALGVATIGAPATAAIAGATVAGVGATAGTVKAAQAAYRGFNKLVELKPKIIAFEPKDKLDEMIYKFYSPDARKTAMQKIGTGARNINESLVEASVGLRKKGGFFRNLGAAALVPLEIGSNITGGIMGSEKLQKLVHHVGIKNRVSNTEITRGILNLPKNVASNMLAPAGKGIAKTAYSAVKFGARNPLLMGTAALIAGVAGSALGDVANTDPKGEMSRILREDIGGSVGLAGMAYLSGRDRTSDLSGTDLARSASKPNRPDGPMAFGGGGSVMGGGKNYSMGASGDLTLALSSLRRGR